MKYKVLLAEDEHNLRMIVSAYLSGHGFEVDTVANGVEAEAAVDCKVYDVVILDIMMPMKDGMEVCRYIRRRYDVPVIFLTALGQEENIISGYEVGADEYITKPVSMPVLAAKTHALVKRYHGLLVEHGIVRIGNLKIELAKRLVTLNEKVLHLAPKEYELLIYLIENRNQVLSREQILNHVWGAEYDGYDRAVDTHIKKLRASLGDFSHHIKTILKQGYMWEE